MSIGPVQSRRWVSKYLIDIVCMELQQCLFSWLVLLIFGPVTDMNLRVFWCIVTCGLLTIGMISNLARKIISYSEKNKLEWISLISKLRKWTDFSGWAITYQRALEHLDKTSQSRCHCFPEKCAYSKPTCLLSISNEYLSRITSPFTTVW